MKLNISRLVQLIKIELTQNFKQSILIIGLIYFIVSFLSIISYFFEEGRTEVDIHSIFISITIIGGIILGSASFAEISKRHTRINYLNLPASPSEKVLSKALINIILFPVAMLVLFLIQKFIFGGLESATNGAIFVTKRFDIEIPYLVSTILLVTSLFFYGSVRFNNYAFPLTLVWLILGFLFLALITFISMFFIFPEFRQAILGDSWNVEISEPNIDGHWLINIFKTLFYLAPLIFVGLSIVCLKEKEG